MTSKVVDKTAICILGMLSSIVSPQAGLPSEIFMAMLWIIYLALYYTNPTAG
jgi:hypothetical protein